MKYLIFQDMGLGDILNTFPAARHLTEQGHEVHMFCDEPYRDILHLASYIHLAEVRPWSPGIGTFLPEGFDKLLEMRVHVMQPEYRGSKKRWRRFAYERYPETAGAVDHPIVFDRIPERIDYGLPKDYILLAPYGFSQSFRPSIDWWIDVIRCKMGTLDGLHVLAPISNVSPGFPVVVARRLSHLAFLIADAKAFFTINSAPTYIASAVRRSYYHVRDEGHNGQEDFVCPQQIPLYECPVERSLKKGLPRIKVEGLP